MNMLTNHPPTEALQAIDSAHHMHPFTNGAALAEIGPRIIKSARGVWLTDTNGNRILDAMAGLWCVNVGYGRDSIAEAAARQMRELPYYNTFFQTSHVPAIALAQKLAEIAPGNLNHVFYALGGSDANDTNVRLVRHYWAAMGKPTKTAIISRKNAYHGSTMAGASLGGMSGMHAQGGLPIPGIHHINQPDWWSEGGEMSPKDFGIARARELEAKIAELGEDNVAAFIAEPIQGAGGVIIPPESYWPEIQAICDAHEILLIADEVICGFGRTGKMFGSQSYDIRPDIMTVAKGLSSGYAAIGASIVSDDVAQVVAEAGEFNHGYTYSGHPVSCAVALENLRILEEEKLVENVAEVTGPYLAEKWQALADHPLIGEATIRGFMASVAMTPDKSARAPFEAPKGTVGLIARGHAFANGLVMRHVGDRMIVAPPLVLTKSDVDLMIERAVKVFDLSLAQIKDEGIYR
ncbi:aspartate aminotransferase family protein [Tropicimonas sp. IMCC6043]|uniref:aspartate aminotransferase family protein n=1 Tax=Tropicimonas sp. IMCC6043 TaxID=2510645 RepID=UPI00101CD438|nr:aspartate aminotransferase family protein [Tropicimonas sp. IMCC6043]RYH09316.1 aspartate aminotransferase family protein [Tropicimonas sp. IMCC6043]